MGYVGFHLSVYSFVRCVSFLCLLDWFGVEGLVWTLQGGRLLCWFVCCFLIFCLFFFGLFLLFGCVLFIYYRLPDLEVRSARQLGESHEGLSMLLGPVSSFFVLRICFESFTRVLLYKCFKGVSCVSKKFSDYVLFLESKLQAKSERNHGCVKKKCIWQQEFAASKAKAKRGLLERQVQ